MDSHVVSDITLGISVSVGLALYNSIDLVAIDNDTTVVNSVSNAIFSQAEK